MDVRNRKILKLGENAQPFDLFISLKVEVFSRSLSIALFILLFI